MRLLCVFLKRELELYEEQKDAVHISYFTPFYCVAQAVFLIFCFRWRDLKEGGVGDDDNESKEEDTDELGLNVDLSAEKARVSSWIKELDVMQQVVVHPLNPLRVSPLSFCTFILISYTKLSLTDTYLSLVSSAKRMLYSSLLP